MELMLQVSGTLLRSTDHSRIVSNDEHNCNKEGVDYDHSLPKEKSCILARDGGILYPKYTVNGKHKECQIKVKRPRLYCHLNCDYLKKITIL